MHILSISHYYPPHVGGLEVVAQKQAKSLAAQGHQVTVITFASPESPSGIRDEEGVTVIRVPGLHFFDTRFGIPFPIGGYRLWRTIWKGVCASDVVHVHDVFYLSSWITHCAARWYKKPVVLTQHVGMVAHPNALVTAIQRVVYRTWGTWMFAACKKIVVYNKNVYDFLRAQQVPAHKIVELRNGIDTTIFHPHTTPHEREAVRTRYKLPLERPLALFVGRFVPKKGYREVYDARDASYDVVFVGTGTVPQEWQTTPQVHILGALGPEQLAELYRAVDVFVFPAQGELFTLTMQEALASGLPVITTNEPAYASYGIDTDALILCEPVAAVLKEQLVRVVRDPALRARMSAYAVSLAQERFDWEKNFAPIIELYTRLERVAVRPVVTTSWDDGHRLDGKLAALLDKYNVRGTFYIAPSDREFAEGDRITDDEIRSLAERHEIGAHTMTHRHLTTISDEEAYKEMVDSREYLEQVTGRPITSFCYPAGMHTSVHARIAERAGFHLARTVRRFSFRSDNSFELDTSIHTYDHWLDVWPLLRFVRYNPIAFLRLYRAWDAQAIAMFEYVVAHGGVFHLWGHSWEVDAHGDWDRLERVLAHIHGRPGVTYVSNGALIV
jgi:D-inositol-3-phosphate glycosyltransferase